MSDPLEILAKFGHREFKPAQEEIIGSIMDQKNVLALLPTGGGKSLCFQIPALAQEGICIVISPLIALMQDQVNNLKAKGIKAISLESGISHAQLDTLLDNCVYGNYKFLYLSPERLQQEIVLARIARMNVNLIAVDEAHCISKWGHDFRPAYRKITILKTIKPNVPIIALTATATEVVMKDIQVQLELAEPVLVKRSFERKNISFHTRMHEDKRYYLEQMLKKNPGTSIIYVRSRRKTLELSNFLNSKGFRATAYHGGITAEEKKNRLQKWLAEELDIMVATNAFGMGIDKANVRSVIHYDLPESLESYFQEVGRAGRDGKPAVGILLYNHADLDNTKNRFLKVLPNLADVKKVYRKLQSYFGIAYGEGENTRHDFNFSEFCSNYELQALKTHNALQLMDRCSIVALSKNFKKKVELRFLVTNHQLLFFLENNGKCELLVKTLLRTYPGIFDYPTPIDVFLMQSKTNLSENTIFSLLELLGQQEIIEYSMSKHDATINFLVPREDDQTINPFSAYIKQQQTWKTKELDAVLKYTTNNQICKNVQLLTYFGETDHGDCGICSVCQLKKNKKNTKSILKKNNELQTVILNELEKENLSSRNLIERLDVPPENVLEVLRSLLENKKIVLTPANTYAPHHVHKS